MLVRLPFPHCSESYEFLNGAFVIATEHGSKILANTCYSVAQFTER